MPSARLPCSAIFSRLPVSIAEVSSISARASSSSVAIPGAAVSFSSSSSSIDSVAKLLTKLSGFLISCAIPAVSCPSEAIFAEWIILACAAFSSSCAWRSSCSRRRCSSNSLALRTASADWAAKASTSSTVSVEKLPSSRRSTTSPPRMRSSNSSGTASRARYPARPSLSQPFAATKSGAFDMIGHLDRRAGHGGLADRALAASHRIGTQLLGDIRLQPVAGAEMKPFALGVVLINHAGIRAGEFDGAGDHHAEHGLRVERRADRAADAAQRLESRQVPAADRASYRERRAACVPSRRFLRVRRTGCSPRDCRR